MTPQHDTRIRSGRRIQLYNLACLIAQILFGQQIIQIVHVAHRF